MLASGAAKGIIGIEDNKPDAIELMQKKVAGEATSKSASARKSIPRVLKNT